MWNISEPTRCNWVQGAVIDADELMRRRERQTQRRARIRNIVQRLNARQSQSLVIGASASVDVESVLQTCAPLLQSDASVVVYTNNMHVRTTCVRGTQSILYADNDGIMCDNER